MNATCQDLDFKIKMLATLTSNQVMDSSYHMLEYRHLLAKSYVTALKQPNNEKILKDCKEALNYCNSQLKASLGIFDETI